MKCVGLMVIGPHERRLEEVLTQRKELCDEVIIAGNNTDEDSERLIKSFGFWFYRDDREWGKEQPYIKNDLLARARKLHADWFLPSDADELYDSRFTRSAFEELALKSAVAYYFAVINFWDDEEHYRHDMSFWNIRMFRNRPDLGTLFEKRNVHCGWAPPAFYRFGCHAPFMVKHYGILDKNDREKKIERYRKYDTANTRPEYYEKLDGRWEGKPLIRKFDEEQLHARIKRDVETHFKDETKKYV